MSGAPPPPPSPRLWPIWLAWTVFVVYGSLVPLDYRPLTFDAAWQRLLQAPMLTLGVERRADWVANGVLYLPVGFLTTGLLMGGRPGWPRKAAAALLGVGFGIALAVAVELAQTAFPPRTVSRNDLLAEAIGSVLGMLGAMAGARRFRLLLAGYGIGGGLFARRLGLAYALLFPALALFPFDLLVSAAEWRAKLAGPQIGLLLAGSSLELGAIKLLAKLAVETLVVLPLGALWVAWRDGPFRNRRPGTRINWLPAALLGGLLGLLIESAQLAFASGQSQGISVITRALGFTLGAVAWRRLDRLTAEAVQARVRAATSVTLMALLALLVLYNGAWRGPWISADSALLRLGGEVRFVPFYYHYYTTEMHAVISLVAVSLSYAPLGVLGWAWHARAGVVAAMALLLSAAMELSKLFAGPTHPDPTNLWIAAAASWMAQMMLRRLFVRTTAPAPRLAR